MANPFTKGWRYLMALFSSKVDEYADPKVQIQQAIEISTSRHKLSIAELLFLEGDQSELRQCIVKNT